MRRDAKIEPRRASPGAVECAMSPAAQKIRRLGFRKWYERELLHSHANLVLLLLSAIGLLASAEVYDRGRGLLEQIELLASALASAAIGVFALRRYLYLLNHAEYVADQAICRNCDSYAAWDLIGEDGPVLRVRCRRCRNEWGIEL
jgi:hypothetical protein